MDISQPLVAPTQPPQAAVPPQPTRGKSDQKKLVISIAIGVVLALVVGIVALFGGYLGTRAPVVPGAQEEDYIVGGLIKSQLIEGGGEHTLELRARTQSGEQLSDSVTFTVESPE